MDNGVNWSPHPIKHYHTYSRPAFLPPYNSNCRVPSYFESVQMPLQGLSYQAYTNRRLMTSWVTRFWKCSSRLVRHTKILERQVIACCKTTDNAHIYHNRHLINMIWAASQILLLKKKKKKDVVKRYKRKVIPSCKSLQIMRGQPAALCMWVFALRI